MKVSQRTIYGIMAALDLALQNGATPVQAKSISTRQGIPLRFLEQVLHAMKQAGLVDSLRGAQGGYLLRKTPDAVSMAEIVEALEGLFSPAVSREPVSRRGQGRIRSDSLLGLVWDRVRQAELGVLSAVTLQELAERHQQLEQERALMYHI